MHYKVGKIYEWKATGERFLLIGRKKCIYRDSYCYKKCKICKGELIVVGDVMKAPLGGTVCGYLFDEIHYKEVKE
jgi:hypothetical protein